MYRGHYRVAFPDEDAIHKIEEMLMDKWHAIDVEVKKYPRWWEIHFSTDDNQKAGGLDMIIMKYKGKVLKKWIDKVNQ